MWNSCWILHKKRNGELCEGLRQSWEVPLLKALLCYAAELAFHMKHLENLAYDPRQNEKKKFKYPKML